MPSCTTTYNLSQCDVLVLDMDGVINGHDHFSYRGTPAGRERRATLFAAYDTITAIELNMTDPACTQRLSGLIHKLGLKVVISSSWRDNRKPHNFEFIFKALGYPLPKDCILGCTPVMDEIDEQKRGHEIQAWFDANGEPSRYLCIDDDSASLFLDHQPLYQTDQKTGITDLDIAQIALSFT